MKKLLFLLFLPLFAIAQIPDPLPNTYVNDLTGKLTTEQIKQLNESIYSIEKKSSVQIAIVLINKLPENYEIEDYAREIGRKWHVGNAKNGLVYVVAIDQHKQRLEVAQQLEGDLPDVVTFSILAQLRPYFKKEDYFSGLQILLSDINEKIDPAIKEQNRLAQIEQEKKDKNIENIAIIILIIVLGLGLISLAIWFFHFLPIKKRKEEEENKKREEAKRKYRETRSTFMSSTPRYKNTSPTSNKSYYNPPTSPIIIVPTEEPKPYKSSYDDSSSSSSSSSNDSSSFGNWGSGSSDSSSSSDSGFSGGGSSSDW